MKDQHRSLIAAALSFLVLIGWYYFYGSRSPVATSPTAVTSPIAQTPPTQPSQNVSSTTPAATESVSKPETFAQRETPLLTLEWASHGGRLSKVLLKNYRQDVKKESPEVNLVPFPEEKSLSLLCQGCSAALPVDNAYEAVPELGGDSGRTIRFEATTDDLKVIKTYEWSEDQYLLNLKVAVENRSVQDFRGRVGLGWKARQWPPKPKGFLSFLEGPGDHRSFLYKLGPDVK